MTKKIHHFERSLAKKQVERTRTDPNMLIVTYSCEHHHPWPTPRNQNHHNQNHSPPNKRTTTTMTSAKIDRTNSPNSYEAEEERDEEKEKPKKFVREAEQNSNEKYMPLVPISNDYGWFSEFESCTMLESPILTEAWVTDADLAMALTMRDDDESFFADLGELLECSTVFHREMMEREEEPRRHGLAPCCGTTG